MNRTTKRSTSTHGLNQKNEGKKEPTFINDYRRLTFVKGDLLSAQVRIAKATSI